MSGSVILSSLEIFSHPKMDSLQSLLTWGEIDVKICDSFESLKTIMAFERRFACDKFKGKNPE